MYFQIPTWLSIFRAGPTKREMKERERVNERTRRDEIFVGARLVNLHFMCILTCTFICTVYLICRYTYTYKMYFIYSAVIYVYISMYKLMSIVTSSVLNENVKCTRIMRMAVNFPYITMFLYYYLNILISVFKHHEFVHCTQLRCTYTKQITQRMPTNRK